jgi:hypothetical protein
MTIKVITTGEIAHIIDTFTRIAEEFASIEDTFGYELDQDTSSMILDSSIILESINSFAETVSIEELDEISRGGSDKEPEKH